jgi:hypothetical protein
MPPGAPATGAVIGGMVLGAEPSSLSVLAPQPPSATASSVLARSHLLRICIALSPSTEPTRITQARTVTHLKTHQPRVLMRSDAQSVNLNST